MSDQTVDPNVELPPPIQQLIAQVKGDRKKLLKDKAFEDPAHLRQFLGQFLLPRMVTMIEILGEGLVDNYNVSLGNASTIQRLHAWTKRHFEDLDLDVDDELPGVDTELLSQIGQALHQLGAVLQQKLPDDQEVGQVYNIVVAAFARLTAQLMGDDDGEDGDDGDDDDDDGPADEAGDDNAVSDGEPSDGNKED